MLDNKIILNYLKNSEAKNLKGLSKIKTIYRPYICPFDDLLNNIPHGTSMFDVGCGAGSFLSLIANFNEPKKIAGIEISDKLIEDARSLLSKFNLEQHIYKYDGNTIPTEIAEYDYVSMIDVYHHIPPKIQEQFMHQLYSKMKPGAILIFKDINNASPFVLMNKLHDLLLSKEIGNEISLRKALGLLKSIGFHIMSVEKKQMYVYPHYTIYAKK
jgi:2-polyprenyl-3-methyl-5-hydroxy-6-metoxy-1,4-benzoquinol methylase